MRQRDSFFEIGITDVMTAIVVAAVSVAAFACEGYSSTHHPSSQEAPQASAGPVDDSMCVRANFGRLNRAQCVQCKAFGVGAWEGTAETGAWVAIPGCIPQAAPAQVPASATPAVAAEPAPAVAPAAAPAPVAVAVEVPVAETYRHEQTPAYEDHSTRDMLTGAVIGAAGGYALKSLFSRPKSTPPASAPPRASPSFSRPYKSPSFFRPSTPRPTFGSRRR